MQDYKRVTTPDARIPIKKRKTVVASETAKTPMVKSRKTITPDRAQRYFDHESQATHHTRKSQKASKYLEYESQGQVRYKKDGRRK